MAYISVRYSTANANHRYDTVDYFNVDPSLGGNEAFTLLVKEAHHRGMKIMLDAVFNHVGDQHPLWLDVVANGKASPYHDWFWIREFPVYEDKPREQWDYQNLRYETFGNVASHAQTEHRERTVSCLLAGHSQTLG